ncbi:B3GALNT2 [Bugula neritina]|uniref:Hexosyltransferase n=1 Tax=Bugula neritina TaxID=10212 RepID=A0A7J7J943_BUGNE|nr:B3GALNT2 [Bugula neritina]
MDLYMYKILAISLALISILLLIVLKNQESEYDLVIIVLSARDHFFQRNVIRETWKTSAANVSVKTLFAVGKECLIHPSDRIDEFSCRMWNISLEEIMLMMKCITVGVTPSNIPFNSSPGMEFIFNVIHPIEVHELTIQSSCLRELKRGNITITLYDRKTDDSLTSVDLDLNNISSSFHTNITKIRIPQNSILLPKDFEGVITVEGGKCSSELLERVECSPFLDCVDSRSDPVVGMNFKILGIMYSRLLHTISTIVLHTYNFHFVDKNRLRGFIQDRSYRQDAWSLVQKKRSSELQQESSLYKDMLFIDAVDTYRNLPEKLLQSLQWYEEQT